MDLKVPVFVKDADEQDVVGGLGSWCEGGASFIPTPLLGGWMGQSERCTLPSLFATMGVAKSDRDPFGRWSPSGSDDYVRT